MTQHAGLHNAGKRDADYSVSAAIQRKPRELLAGLLPPSANSKVHGDSK